MFGEDIDLSTRIRKAGFTVELFPEAYVYHKRRVSLKSFYRQVYVFVCNDYCRAALSGNGSAAFRGFMGKQALWVCRRRIGGRRIDRRYPLGHFCKQTGNSKIRQTDNRLCDMRVSHQYCFDIVLLRNYKLHHHNHMLLCNYGIFNHFHRADDVLYSNGNSSKFDRKDHCRHSYGFYVCTAVGQCLIWYPV